MTPYMTIIIICVLIIAYGILFYYYKAENNKRRYLWNLYYGEHKQKENRQMTKEKAYEVIKERGFGYTEDEFLEALSVVEEAFGFVREVSHDAIDLTVATWSGNEVDYTFKNNK